MLWSLKTATVSDDAHVSQTINWMATFLTLVIVFNVLATSAILVRLEISRRRLTKALGDEHLLRQYTDVSAMITESGAIFSVFSLCIATAYVTNNHALELLLPMASPLQVCISMSSHNYDINYGHTRHPQLW